VIALDASAAVAFITGIGASAADLSMRIEGDTERAAPHLIDVEVSRALRRLAAAEEVSIETVPACVDTFFGLRMARYPHRGLVDRVWQLRDSVATFDAFYVALAEVLGAALLTCDGRLARSHGHGARIEHFAP